MIWSKLIPWAGYPLAVALFFFWLDGRENLAAEVGRCNSDKLMAVAEAQALARSAAAAAYAEHLAQLEQMNQAANDAVTGSQAERDAALARAAASQQIINNLMESLENENDAPIGRVCLVANVPGVILDRMR